MRLDGNQVQLGWKDDDADHEWGGYQVPDNDQGIGAQWGLPTLIKVAGIRWQWPHFSRVIDAYEGKPMFTLAGYQNNKVGKEEAFCRVWNICSPVYSRAFQSKPASLPTPSLWCQEAQMDFCTSGELKMAGVQEFWRENIRYWWTFKNSGGKIKVYHHCRVCWTFNID